MTLKMLRVFFPFIAYLMVVGTVFFYAINPPFGKMIFAPDIWRYHYYTKPFLFQQLFKGTIPLWNPYTFSGMPYLEQPQVTPWYPPMFLFAVLPIAQAISWYLAFHIFLAMAGMYFFVRSLRISGIGQIGMWPSWIAGVTFGLSGFFVGRIYAGHIDIIASSSWLPIVLVVFLRLMDKPTRKRAILSGLSLALQIFAGYQTIAIFTMEAIGLLVLFKSISSRLFRPFFYTTSGIVLGLGMAAVQIIPNAKFVSESVRSLPLPHAWSTVATPTPYHLLELIDPFFFYEKIPKVGLGHEHAAYIGKIPLLFVAIVFLWMVKHKRYDIYLVYFFVLGILAWWVALAQYAPIDLWAILQKILPFYNQLRIPSRHVLLFVLGGSSLAGIGFCLKKNRFILSLVTVLVLTDLISLAWKNIYLGPVPEIAEDRKLIDAIKNHGELFRYLPAFYAGSSPRENLEFATPMRYELYSISGYDNPQLRRYTEFLMAVNGVTNNDLGPYTETIPPYANLESPFTDFLNIRFIFVPYSQDLALIDSKRFVSRLSEAARGYRLFENTSVLPRFYFVPMVRVLSDAESVLAAIRSGSIDPRRVVLVQKDQNLPVYSPDCPPEGEGIVSEVSYKNSSVSLKASSPCNGFLVSSEVMYPGWTAAIDGVKTPLITGNHAFRVIALPRGNHVITFTYRPNQLLYGGLISITTIIASVGLLIIPRKRLKFLPVH